MTLFTSAVLRNKAQEKLCSEMADNKNLILYFDTEQSDYDSATTVSRIEKLAGSKDNFKAFSLRDCSPRERLRMIEQALVLWGEHTAYCVIDGIADLANGINIEEEATLVVTMLLKLSKTYNCHICVAIHQNKNNDYATGHLGSALMKKAEVVISVVKNTEDKSITDVFCEQSRGEEFDTFSIRVDENELPEIIDYREPEKKPLSFQTNKEYVDYTEPRS